MIVENDVCVHLYLLIASILSDEELTCEFKSHTDFFLRLSSPPPPPVTSTLNQNDHQNIDVQFDFNPFSDLNETDFDNALTNENIALIDVPNLIDYNTNAMDSIIENYDTSTIEGLELTDCQIELMDQFKLTDQIDLCQSEIELTDADLLGESLNNFPPFLIENEQTQFVEQSKIGTVTSKCIGNHQKVFDCEDGSNEGDVRTTIEFECWLDFVLERISSAMNFNGTGFVNQMIFHVSNVSLFILLILYLLALCCLLNAFYAKL